MNTAMEKEVLAQILDQAVQDVTECTAGVRLHQGEQSPGEDLCTVQITFDRGFHTSLTLCADTGLLYRMACNSFHEDSVSPGSMFQATKVPAHFGPPVFYHGRYEPEGREIQFVLTYSDEHFGGAQLIHHVPSSDKDGAVSGEA